MALRLPERFQNRWGYAVVAFLVSAVTPWFVFKFLGVIFDPQILSSTEPSNQSYNWDGLAQNTLLFAVPAAIAAALSWPSGKMRSHGRMALAGVTTVVLTICLICIYLQFDTPKSFDFFEFLGNMGLMVFIVSIFSFGVPYGLAVAVSMVFVSDS